VRADDDRDAPVRFRPRSLWPDDSRRLRAAAARRAALRVARRAEGADRSRCRARPAAVRPPFTVESPAVAAGDFTFTLHLAEDVRFDQMLRELTDKVLRHAGFSDKLIVEIADELEAGVAAGRTHGVGCDVEFLVRDRTLEVVVLQGGRSIFRTSRR